MPGSAVQTTRPEDVGTRERIRRFPWTKALFAIGLTILLIMAFGPIPEPSWQQVPFRDGVRALRGHAPLSDLVQDVYGMRALAAGTNPYIPTEQAATALGIEWRGALLPSTHPPTAFLLTAPVAFLPWSQSSALWAWAMLALLAVGLRLSGLSWVVALALTPILMLWWPTAPVLGQIVLIWLVCALLAYQYRFSPFISGVWIGLASLTKFLPAVLLLPFLLRREWRAVAGFIVVWLLAAMTLLILSPDAFRQYLEANRTASPATLWVANNVSLIAIILQSGHVGLLIPFGAFLLGAIFLYRDDLLANNQAAWWLTQTLAVVLLPLAWHYSLFPLIPVWIGLFRRGGNVQKLVVVIVAGTVVFGQVHLTAAWAIALAGTLAALVLYKRAPSRVKVPEPAH